MTNHASLPFALPLLPDAFAHFERGSSIVSRRLSDISASYADQAAVERLLSDDPVLYEFYALRNVDTAQKLIFGLTVIYPGTVGDEYYMTKGHFHASAADGDELYMVMRGSGHLLLQARDGESRVIEMQPGALFYTPATWAHRTVNSGSDELVFLSIWSHDVQYDYETIEQRGGFPVRVVQRDGTPTVIPNASFQLD